MNALRSFFFLLRPRGPVNPGHDHAPLPPPHADCGVAQWSFGPPPTKTIFAQISAGPNRIILFDLGVDARQTTGLQVFWSAQCPAPRAGEPIWPTRTKPGLATMD